MYVYPFYIWPYTSMHSTHAQEGNSCIHQRRAGPSCVQTEPRLLTTVENGHAEVDASHGASVPSPSSRTRKRSQCACHKSLTAAPDGAYAVASDVTEPEHLQQEPFARAEVPGCRSGSSLLAPLNKGALWREARKPLTLSSDRTRTHTRKRIKFMPPGNKLRHGAHLFSHGNLCIASKEIRL